MSFSLVYPESIGELIKEFLILVFVYGLLRYSLWTILQFIDFMEKLGNHMIENQFFIKKGYFRVDHPGEDTTVGKWYSYCYYYNAVAGKWIVRGITLFTIVLFFVQLISLLTTGKYFRGHILFA